MEIVKLDLKDRKLLYELDKDSRQSNAAIGKKIRLNKNTVNYKIKRLEKEGVILGYYPVIDISKIGYFLIRSYLKFFNTTKAKEKEIIDWLVKDTQVGVVVEIDTIYDLALMVPVKNIYEFDEFWISFKKKFRKHFWEERVDIFSGVYHFKRKYLIDKKDPEKYEYFGNKEIVEHDELDMGILQILSKNAKTPLIDIAEKLKTPERTIAFRIKKLEKNKIIQGYRVNINLAKIGYEYFKVNMILNSMEDYDKLFSYTDAHPNIIYYDKTISNYDFEIDVEIESKEKLLELLADIKQKFRIRNIEILSFKEYYKLGLLPRENANKKTKKT